MSRIIVLLCALNDPNCLAKDSDTLTFLVPNEVCYNEKAKNWYVRQELIKVHMLKDYTVADADCSVNMDN